MSQRAEKTIQRSTSMWMIDRVELWNPSSSTHDDETLIEEHEAGEKIWGPGPARIRPTSGPREQAVGDTVLALRDADILLPLTVPLPWVEQEIKVVKSRDTALVGRWFRITDVRVFSQQPARLVSVVQHQRSPDWNPDA